MTNQLLLTMIVAVILSLRPAHASGEVRWRGNLLVQVGSKADLPDPIRSALHMDVSGIAGVADPGQQFNTGDAHVRDWPDRSLIGAGHAKGRWIVLLVQNGGQSAPSVWLYEFDGSTLIDHKRLRYWRGAEDTFITVVAELVRQDAH